MNFLRTIQYRIIQARQNRLFMRFNGPLRGIRLSITSAGRDSESGAAFISLHPLVALDQPEILLSYVKARLFSLMPSAVAPC